MNLLSSTLSPPHFTTRPTGSIRLNRHGRRHRRGIVCRAFSVQHTGIAARRRFPVFAANLVPIIREKRDFVNSKGKYKNRQSAPTGRPEPGSATLLFDDGVCSLDIRRLSHGEASLRTPNKDDGIDWLLGDRRQVSKRRDRPDYRRHQTTQLWHLPDCLDGVPRPHAICLDSASGGADTKRPYRLQTALILVTTLRSGGFAQAIRRACPAHGRNGSGQAGCSAWLIRLRNCGAHLPC